MELICNVKNCSREVMIKNKCVQHHMIDLNNRIAIHKKEIIELRIENEKIKNKHKNIFARLLL